MQEDITLYFSSVAEALLIISITILSGAALTSGYTVLKNHHQRPGFSTAWGTFTTWLLIAVELALAVHLIDAIARPNWVTVGVTAAIAVIQLALNSVVRTGPETRYSTLRNEGL
jgi:uncharacterized membrane protein